VTLEPRGKGTKYTAIAIHRDEATRKQHEAMGFHEGWGQTLDQLVALAKKLCGVVGGLTWAGRRDSQIRSTQALKGGKPHEEARGGDVRDARRGDAGAGRAG
jgi:hypothetical protein